MLPAQTYAGTASHDHMHKPTAAASVKLMQGPASVSESRFEFTSAFALTPTFAVRLSIVGWLARLLPIILDIHDLLPLALALQGEHGAVGL